MPPARFSGARRRRSKPPGGFTWRAPHPTLGELYNAGDRATGEERRELYRMAADLRRALDGRDSEEVARLVGEANRRLGLLLL